MSCLRALGRAFANVSGTFFLVKATNCFFFALSLTQDTIVNMEAFNLAKVKMESSIYLYSPAGVASKLGK